MIHGLRLFISLADGNAVLEVHIAVFDEEIRDGGHILDGCLVDELLAHGDDLIFIRENLMDINGVKLNKNIKYKVNVR